MSEGLKRSAPEAEGPNKAPRTSLQASPASMPPLNDPVDKEIYVLQLRERILQQETAKLEVEERILKARTQAARATEAADEEDFFNNEELPGEVSASLDSIRNRFGAIEYPINTSNKYTTINSTQKISFGCPHPSDPYRIGTTRPNST
jgi:hypothetical protein